MKNILSGTFTLAMLLGLGACFSLFNGEKAESRECLALNIYHEARNQPVNGQYAVAHVTMNRVASLKHADNICDVVYADKQFSWTWTLSDTTPDDQKAYKLAYTIASEVMSNTSKDNTGGADHYHADYVNPFWATEEFMIKTAEIGTHIFYKAK